MDAKKKKQLNQPDLSQKISLKKKVMPDDKAKKTSKKIDASGVLKYPFSSLSNMMYVFFK